MTAHVEVGRGSLGKFIITFFTSAGRTSIPRMLVVSGAVLAVLWASSFTTWENGIAVNAIIGALSGAAVGKFGVEARRRIRDAGHSMRLVGSVWLVLGLLELASLLAFFQSDPDWAQRLFVILNYIVPLAAAAFLLSPSRRTVATVGSEAASVWRGPMFGAACVLAGVAVASALTSYALGVREAIERRADFEDSRGQVE